MNGLNTTLPDPPHWDVFLLHSQGENSSPVTGFYRAFCKLSLKTFCECECVDWGKFPLESINSALLGCRVVVAIVSQSFFHCQISMRLLQAALHLSQDKKEKEFVLVSVDALSFDHVVRKASWLPTKKHFSFTSASDYDRVARHVQCLLEGTPFCVSDLFGLSYSMLKAL